MRKRAKVENSQNAITKMVLASNLLSDAAKLLSDAGWPTLARRVRSHVAATDRLGTEVLAVLARTLTGKEGK